VTTKEGRSIRSSTFDDFFDRHFDRTRRLIEVILGDPTLAEDAAQEAFARAFRGWDQVSAMNRPAGWVLTVGLNYARDSFRRERRASLHRKRSTSGPDFYVDAERDMDLVSQVRALPMRQRQAVVLHYLVDLSIEEVAAQMDCALGTVKSTLNAALTKLRVDTEEMK
jgi:RNA polymerase sigma-70 factor (ECF subfamily)